MGNLVGVLQWGDEVAHQGLARVQCLHSADDGDICTLTAKKYRWVLLWSVGPTIKPCGRRVRNLRELLFVLSPLQFGLVIPLFQITLPGAILQRQLNVCCCWSCIRNDSHNLEMLQEKVLGAAAR